MIYNIAYTSLPIIFYVLDKDYPEKTLIENPSLYGEARRKAFLNYRVMFYWFSRALYQGIAVFVITVFAFHNIAQRDGQNVSGSYDSLSLVSYTAIIIVNTFTIISESNNITILNHIIIWGTLVVYYISIYIYNLFNNDMHMVMNNLFSLPSFWLTTVIASAAALLPMYIYNCWKGVLFLSSDLVVKRKSLLYLDDETGRLISSLDLEVDRKSRGSSFKQLRRKASTESGNELDDQHDRTPLLNTGVARKTW